MSNEQHASELVEHVDGVRRLARHLIRDPELARDVAQDSLAHAATRQPTGVRNLGSWIRGVVRLKSLQTRRAEKRRRRHEGELRARTVPSTTELAARLDAHALLLASIKAMPPLYSSVVWSRYVDDVPAAEIAQRLDLPIETVRTRIKRGVRLLREELDKGSADDRRAWRGALALLVRGDGATAGRTLAALTSPLGIVATLSLALMAVAALALWRTPAATDPRDASTTLADADTNGAERSEAGRAMLDPGRRLRAPPDEPAPQTAAAPPSAPGGAPPSQDDPALPSERRPIDVTVVDLEGEPVPRARIAGRWGEWYTREFVADDEGRARVEVPPYTHALEIRGQVGIATGNYCLLHYHPLTSDAVFARVEVRSYRSVNGRVSSAQPLPQGTSVTAYRLHFSGDPTSVKASLYRRAQRASSSHVRPDGSFTLDLPDDAPVALLYGDGTPGSVSAVALRVSPGTNELVLRAGPGHADSSLKLRLRGPDGLPAVGARVACRAVDPAPGANRAGQKNAPGVAHEAVSDLHGWVTFNGLRRWVYEVHVPAETESDAPWRDLRTLCATDTDRLDIQLLPPVQRLAGRVVDAGGRPVAGAWVCAMRGGMYLACMGTDEQGHFRGPAGVGIGVPVQVSARHPMQKPTSRGHAGDVLAGDDPITIQLEPFAHPVSPDEGGDGRSDR